MIYVGHSDSDFQSIRFSIVELLLENATVTATTKTATGAADIPRAGGERYDASMMHRD